MQVIGRSVLGMCVIMCKCEYTCCFSFACTDIALGLLQYTRALTNCSRPTISCNIYPVTWDYFHANGSEKDFPRATYDCTRQLEYFIGKYCNDLFELWELLEEMPAELELCPLCSCRVENECFAVHKETRHAGLGLKHDREMWMDLQDIILLHGPCVLDFCFS